MVLSESLFEDVQIFNGKQLPPEFVTKVIEQDRNSISQEDNGVAAMLNMAMQDELTSIDQYNSMIVSLPDGYQEIKNIITKIIGDCHIHIGELQVALEMVDPQAKLRLQGEAQVHVNNNDNNIILN